MELIEDTSHAKSEQIQYCPPHENPEIRSAIATVVSFQMHSWDSEKLQKYANDCFRSLRPEISTLGFSRLQTTRDP